MERGGCWCHGRPLSTALNIDFPFFCFSPPLLLPSAPDTAAAVVATSSPSTLSGGSWWEGAPGGGWGGVLLKEEQGVWLKSKIVSNFGRDGGLRAPPSRRPGLSLLPLLPHSRAEKNFPHPVILEMWREKQPWTQIFLVFLYCRKAEKHVTL